MALADDLLAQAGTLATLDDGIPSQANLRRAISSAYYALFHLFIAEAVDRLLPAEPPGLRERASRAFSHGEMKQVCIRFLAKRIVEDFAPLLRVSTSPELLFIARTFVNLQEQRHLADYDVGIFLLRAETLLSIDKARRAFTNWKLIRETDEATVFLAALIFAKRWDR
ncbi:MAG TPA: hypothetical protein VFC39_22025 [Acidobacteriaceae bacterium]|nr:hypothetical protein [Acidobacteriaceae bacterium]